MHAYFTLPTCTSFTSAPCRLQLQPQLQLLLQLLHFHLLIELNHLVEIELVYFLEIHQLEQGVLDQELELELLLPELLFQVMFFKTL